MVPGGAGSSREELGAPGQNQPLLGSTSGSTSGITPSSRPSSPTPPPFPKKARGAPGPPCSRGNSGRDGDTHVGGEDLDPARFLLAARVLEAEGHALLVRVPPLHLLPLERDHLVLREFRLRVGWERRRARSGARGEPGNAGGSLGSGAPRERSGSEGRGGFVSGDSQIILESNGCASQIPPETSPGCGDVGQVQPPGGRPGMIPGISGIIPGTSGHVPGDSGTLPKPRCEVREDPRANPGNGGDPAGPETQRRRKSEAAGSGPAPEFRGFPGVPRAAPPRCRRAA